MRADVGRCKTHQLHGILILIDRKASAQLYQIILHKQHSDQECRKAPGMSTVLQLFFLCIHIPHMVEILSFHVRFVRCKEVWHAAVQL